LENFSREQNGYCVKEVDIALARLRKDYETKLSQKDNAISSLERKIQSLQDIVMDYVQREEKTQSVMDSTQNLRALESQRLQLLYKKWNNTLTQIKDKVVPIITQDELLSLTQDFQYALKVVVDTSFSDNGSSKSYAKSILSRMSGIIPMKLDTYKTSTKKSSHVEKKRQRRNPDQIYGLDKKDIKATSDAEKFLNGEGIGIPKSMGLGKEMFAIPPKEFGKNLTKKEECFSLEEALTPKESLEEIMLAFKLDD